MTRAEQCRQAATRLQRDIDKKHTSARNMRALPPTRKRSQDSQGIYNDAIRLEKLQRVLRALAEQHEAGTISPLLAGITSRAGIEREVWRNEALKAIYEGEHRPETQAEKVERMERAFMLQDIPGFFATQPVLADEVVELCDIRPGLLVGELSAGTGALIDAVLRVTEDVRIGYCERNYSLAEFLEAKYSERPHVYRLERDFNDLSVGPMFHRIVLNPPLENGQDAEQITRAFGMLLEDGILVSILSNGALYRSDRKSTQFQRFLEETGAEQFDVADGAFKASGTGVSSRIVRIRTS